MLDRDEMGGSNYPYPSGLTHAGLFSSKCPVHCHMPSALLFVHGLFANCAILVLVYLSAYMRYLPVPSQSLRVSQGHLGSE